MHVRQRSPTLTALLCVGTLCPALALALYPFTARAQWSGSVSAMSEYRYRGTDFSEGKPSVQAGAAYDGRDGWYAGGFAAHTRFAGRGGAQLMAYGGRAGRFANGLSWDAGISTVQVTQDGYGDYHEVYAALSHGGANGGITARLSWSPRYTGGEGRTLYGELDASMALAGPVDAFIHIGTLRTLSGPREPQRSDMRAGLSARFGSTGLQVAYQRNNHRPAYLYGPEPSRHGVIVSVSQGF